MRTLVVLTVLFASGTCLAQGYFSTNGKSSELTVSVKDPAGAVVGNAFVLIRADALERDNPAAFSSELRTDSSGQVKRTIPQGFFDLFIASSGFAPYCRKIRVRNGKSLQIRVILKLDDLMVQEYGDKFE